MNTSFYNGIAGVKTQQFGIDVLGNNISNMGNNGFIAKTPKFSTIFSTTLTDNYFDANSNDIGLGSTASAASLNTFKQGEFQPTDRAFDLALDGNGFFGVKSVKSKTLYTRNGAFNIDANGDMVDDDGNYLLGTLGKNISKTTLPKNKLEEIGTYYKKGSKELGTPYKIEPIDDIVLDSVDAQSKINLPYILYYPAVATTTASFKANLNPKILKDADGNEIANVEHFSSTIISPESKKDILDMTYTKRIPQQEDGSVWDGKIEIYSFYEKYDPTSTYDPTLYKVDKTAKKVYSIIDSQLAVIKFDNTGKLISKEMPTMNNSGSPLNISIGEINTYDGFTSNENITTTRSEKHDGEIEGFLDQYSMDNSGNVVAKFDNGRTIPVAKVAVYHFRNDQGLSNVTSTLFSSTSNSGKAFFYKDENGTPFLGTKIRPNNLETSNTFFSTAMTELLLAQKAFDSSAKCITTSNEMIKNAINMKK